MFKKKVHSFKLTIDNFYISSPKQFHGIFQSLPYHFPVIPLPITNHSLTISLTFPVNPCLYHIQFQPLPSRSSQFHFHFQPFPVPPALAELPTTCRVHFKPSAKSRVVSNFTCYLKITLPNFNYPYFHPVYFTPVYLIDTFVKFVDYPTNLCKLSIILRNKIRSLCLKINTFSKTVD